MKSDIMADEDKKPEAETSAPEKKPEGEEEPAVLEGEECTKEWTPVVKLTEVEVKNMEEDEEVIFKIRAKLFRWDQPNEARDEPAMWRERGVGEVKFLKHKEHKKVRMLMRQDRTMKICMNHYVQPKVELKENVGSDRSWVWTCYDFAEPKEDPEENKEVLAIRFANVENAKKFQEEYNNAQKNNEEIYAKEAEKSE